MRAMLNTWQINHFAYNIIIKYLLKMSKQRRTNGHIKKKKSSFVMESPLLTIVVLFLYTSVWNKKNQADSIFSNIKFMRSTVHG